jgi:hypothetical protein
MVGPQMEELLLVMGQRVAKPGMTVNGMSTTVKCPIMGYHLIAKGNLNTAFQIYREAVVIHSP